MKKYYLHIFFVIVLNAPSCFGQDVHFSQYYLSPLSLNPANTGNYRGDFRFFGNYRSQWKDINDAYKTFSAGGDFNAYPKNINLSGGLVFINDKSGGNLSVQKILPSGAYHFKLGAIKVHLGIQPGLVIKTLNFNAHSFPNQLNWTTGNFDNTLPNFETNQNAQFSYFDLNSGVHVSRRFGKLEPEIGLALFHINKPRESFFTGRNNKLPQRNAYNFNLNYYVSKAIILRGYSLYGYTTKASDWVSGINLEYVFSTNAFYTSSVFAGFMWRSGLKRNADAGIITAGFNYKSYTVGFSYDITFSQLKTSVDSKGAFEMALIYRGKSTRLYKKIVPCERY